MTTTPTKTPATPRSKSLEPTRDLAKITKSGPRNHKLGHRRLALETIFQESETALSRREAAALVGLTSEEVGYAISSMSLERQIIIDPSAGKDRSAPRYLWHTRAPKNTQKATDRAPPVRNSMQPNGSQDYWRQHNAQVNTCARGQSAMAAHDRSRFPSRGR